MDSLGGTATATQRTVTIELEGVPTAVHSRRRVYTIRDDITSRVNTMLRLAAVAARNSGEPAPWWAAARFTVFVDEGASRGQWLVHVRSEGKS